MNSPKVSRTSTVRVVIVGASVCLPLWGYYLLLVVLFYPLPEGQYYPGIILLFMLPPFFIGVLSYRLLHHGTLGRRALFVLPLFVTLLPIAIFGSDPAFPGLEWILLVPISLCMYGGELSAWLLHTGSQLHQRYLKARTKNPQQHELPDLEKLPVNPQLVNVLQVVQDDANAARAHFHTWWALCNLARPQYSDVMNDEQYSDFFKTSTSGHYKLIFASLTKVFDRYSSVAGFEKLRQLLHESERRDLAKILSNVTDGKEEIIRNILKIGNQTILHSQLSPRDKPIHTSPPITAEEIRELVDSICDAVSEVVTDLGQKKQIASGHRYEEAVFNLLKTLRASQGVYEISNIIC
jgi:hypothetical protein